MEQWTPEQLSFLKHAFITLNQLFDKALKTLV
jgi:hypothetical protein